MDPYRVAFQELQLRCELLAHQEDVGPMRRSCSGASCAALVSRRCVQVRGLAATKQGVWTASRDRTVKLWTPVDERLLVTSTTLASSLALLLLQRL